jgi:glycosyltransferase involved in cell wall biosynthesis
MIKISVIIAVYNNAKTLQDCLDSVDKQTYKNVELIVIDGGSNDGTADLLKANHSKINYWISESDDGIYNAWNKALAQATGDWVCFLGADDFFWDMSVLERMTEVLCELSPDVRVAYGQIMLLDQYDQKLHTVGEPWEKVKGRFRQAMCIPHPGAMHRRNLFLERGYFDESFRIAGDYELLLRELKYADAAFVPGLIVAGMRHGGVSSDPQNSIKSLLEVRRAQRMHGQRFPGLTWLSAFVRVFVRLIMWRVLGERTARKLLDAGRRLMKQPPIWTRT